MVEEVESELAEKSLIKREGPGPEGLVDLLRFQGVKTPCSLRTLRSGIVDSGRASRWRANLLASRTFLDPRG